jgi:hypothetical protein
MRLTIANITVDETINAFIHGLHHHLEFRSKLLCQWPRMVQELLTTAKN